MFTEMQTFWLVKGNRTVHDMGDSSVGGSSAMSESDDEYADVELSSQERWIDYNTEIFKGLLQQIIARRTGLRRTKTNDVCTKVSANSNATIPLEEVKEIIELPKFDKAAVKRQGENKDIEVPALIVKQLREYIAKIAALYNNNPFHNFAHASYVVMAVNKYMHRIMAATEIDIGDNDERLRGSVQATLHDHTYGITSDPLNLFACAFSALIHDVNHTGVPNPQLIKVNLFPLAVNISFC